MRNTLLILMLLFPAGAVFGQKFLQLENTRSPKTRKYSPGDEVTFRLSNGQWYTRVIDDISYERQVLIFANGHVEVDSIVAFRTFNRGRWSRAMGNQLYNFGAAWAVFSVIDQLVDGGSVDASPVLVPAATSVATGFLIKKLFRHRTYRITKNSRGEARKWRLRALDLSVK
ncbi:MAG: hypothetical protein HY842_02930 [Bacteroidetes bacterium]|nr:hypothetical protein [Bacteroidota bacterium]